MYVGQILKADTANGVGIRVSVFVSGCTIRCPGCFNAMTWDFCYGKPYTEETEQMIMDELARSYYTGITILGGEPFEPSNQEVIVTLIRRIKKELPEKTIWMYSGYVYDRDLVPGGRRYTPYTDEILDNVDTMVDGPFIQAKKNLLLKFRGSENQRIIDMKATRREERVVLSPLNNVVSK